MLLAICLVVFAGHLSVSKADTTLSFYRGENVSDPFYTLSLENLSSNSLSEVVNKTNFSNDTLIWMYIRGWEDSLADYEIELINAMSQNQSKYLVVSVDYDYLPYTLQVATLEAVAEKVTNFYSSLKETYSYSLNNVVFAGHSLGAHLSGIIGSNLGGEINSIMGLDPAGPLFLPSSSITLKPGDARYVEVMHTTTSLGVAFNCGNSDFWVNGAGTQPGCITVSNCSHLKAILYYFESIFKTVFVGYSSTNSSVTAYMGELDLATYAGGAYNVTTT